MTEFVVMRMILAVLMLAAGVAATVLVLFQRSNSNGVSALSGSSDEQSDSFYGKNKGKRREAKIKMWTYICALVLAITSIMFFILS